MSAAATSAAHTAKAEQGARRMSINMDMLEVSEYKIILYLSTEQIYVIRD